MESRRVGSSRRTAARPWIIACSLVAVLVCSEGAAGANASCDTSAPLDATLLLLGDAGAPSPFEPALLAAAITHAAAREAVGPDRTAMVVLGDLLYPRGLPAPGASGRPKAERRLRALFEQLDASSTRPWLVPGNHDWANAGGDGWASIQRLGEWADRAGARVVPAGGCPGPLRIDLGRHLRLVFLDTQWFLHQGPKPRHPDSTCRADTEAEWIDAIRETLAAPGPAHAVVMAHHPLRTGGPHGGNFSWREHLFPLRETSPWLWLPLPGAGSLYPLVRGAGISNQDLMGRRYRALIAGLAASFAETPPLVYAAGHDHGLQVIEGGGDEPRWHIGSGAANDHLISRLATLPETVFGLAASGFAQIDAFADGAVALAIWVTPRGGDPYEAFQTCLTDTP